MKSALRFTATHLLQALALVLAVVVLNFVLVHSAPGDPVDRDRPSGPRITTSVADPKREPVRRAARAHRRSL